MSVIMKPDQVFDIRLIERYRAKGLFTDNELKKWLADLPDGQENVQYITAGEILGEPPQDNPDQR